MLYENDCEPKILINSYLFFEQDYHKEKSEKTFRIFLFLAPSRYKTSQKSLEVKSFISFTHPKRKRVPSKWNREKKKTKESPLPVFFHSIFIYIYFFSNPFK